MSLMVCSLKLRQTLVESVIIVYSLLKAFWTKADVRRKGQGGQYKLCTGTFLGILPWALSTPQVMNFCKDTVRSLRKLVDPTG